MLTINCHEQVEVLAYLHTGIIDIVREVAITDLERRGFVVDCFCSDNVELRNYMLSLMCENLP
jgi:hypothetical protein